MKAAGSTRALRFQKLQVTSFQEEEGEVCCVESCEEMKNYRAEGSHGDLATRRLLVTWIRAISVGW